METLMDRLDVGREDRDDMYAVMGVWGRQVERGGEERRGAEKRSDMKKITLGVKEERLSMYRSGN